MENRRRAGNSDTIAGKKCHLPQPNCQRTVRIRHLAGRLRSHEWLPVHWTGADRLNSQPNRPHPVKTSPRQESQFIYEHLRAVKR